MGSVFSLGTVSCDDDDDEETKKEQKQDNPDSNKPSDNNNNTPSSPDKNFTPEESGAVMKEVVEKFNEKGSSIIDQATSMTSDQLTNLASTIIEYGKNKDNTEWKETFVKEAGSQEAVEMLDDVIKKLVGDIGVDITEITPSDLVESFKGYFKPVDELGQGYQEGFNEGESHKATIAAVYDEKFASIPTTPDGLTQMMGVFGALPEAQQKEFINAALAWANKEGDDEWKKGFLAGTGLNESDQKALGEKLDYLAQYKSVIMLM